MWAVADTSQQCPGFWELRCLQHRSRSRGRWHPQAPSALLLSHPSARCHMETRSWQKKGWPASPCALPPPALGPTRRTAGKCAYLTASSPGPAGGCRPLLTRDARWSRRLCGWAVRPHPPGLGSTEPVLASACSRPHGAPRGPWSGAGTTPAEPGRRCHPRRPGGSPYRHVSPQS